MTGRPNGEPATEELFRQVVEVLNATVGVGTSLARAVARAATQQSPEGEPAPFDELVRQSATAAGSVISLIVNGLRASGGASANSRPNDPRIGFSAPTPSDAAPQVPSVRAGSTLRMPLAVENRDGEFMRDVRFTCTRVDRLAPGTGTGVTPEDVRFDPDVLTVAGRDFEKLTVRVVTRAETAPGRYRLAIEGAPDAVTTLEFDVVAGLT